MFAIAELDGHLDLKSKYIYTNGMLVGRIDSSGDFYQYFHDGLGSITMIVDSTGQYQNLYTYDDFGDFRKKDEEVSNSYCYTGQERDEEPSGLYNLRARYYAAGMGRFTQEDPIMHLSIRAAGIFGTDYSVVGLFGASSPQMFHGYSYVINSPLNWIDPLGLCKEEYFDFCAAVHATTDIVGGAAGMLILSANFQQIATQQDILLTVYLANGDIKALEPKMWALGGGFCLDLTAVTIMGAVAGCIAAPEASPYLVSFGTAIGTTPFFIGTGMCWNRLYNYYKGK